MYPFESRANRIDRQITRYFKRGDLLCNEKLPQFGQATSNPAKDPSLQTVAYSSKRNIRSALVSRTASAPTLKNSSPLPTPVVSPWRCPLSSAPLVFLLPIRKPP